VEAAPVLLPVGLLTAAALSALIGEWRAGAARGVAIAGTALTLVLASAGLVEAVTNGPIRHQLGGWPAPLGIEYLLDPLSGFILVLIAAIGLAVVAYPTRAGFDVDVSRRVPLHALVLLLLAGLCGVVLSADLFHLFVFLEIYAIATYALVSLGGTRATLASLRYLLFGTIGSGLYLLGVGFLYFMTGSLAMADVGERVVAIQESPTVVAAIALIVIGLALKMALFPLHVWLPEAHSYAPPAVAALLAAVQVKVAAYALVRILYDVFDPAFVARDLPIGDLLAWFGAGGIVFGSAMAVAQSDLKRMLAYSTVSQLGYIGVGIGLATPLALVGALLHVVGHAVMKCCLFLIAGGIYEKTHIREVPRLAGLAQRMPITAAAFVVAALSMVGIPPTIGFFGKWYLLQGSLEAGRPLFAVVIAFSSIVTLWYFLRLFESIYSRPERIDDALADASEPGPAVLTPVLVLAAATVVIGLVNAVIVSQVLAPIGDALLAT
jgi:multicomponent Na+:H+ antiporter subunit D